MNENKTWTLETASQDYRESKKIRRECGNCKFASMSVYSKCHVKRKNISFFGGLQARMCKYYTENR